jgi:hypothetical protein
VLVVVIAVGGVPVPVVVIVDVVAVRDFLVPAVRAVGVLVPRMGQMRQRVLVVVIVMRCVRMPLVHVVGVTLALHAGVPAARPVVMPVLVMYLVVACRHVSSLLC